MLTKQILPRAASAASRAMSGLAQAVPDDPRYQQRLPDVLEPRWATGGEPMPAREYLIDATKFQVGLVEPDDAVMGRRKDRHFLKQNKLVKTPAGPGSEPVLDEQAAADLGAAMRAAFDRAGLVYVRNTGLTDLAEMEKVGQLVMRGSQKYAGGSNNRGQVQGNVYDVGAPSSAWLQYHHEMTYIESSVDKLGFVCRRAPPGERALAGATYLSEGVQVIV